MILQQIKSVKSKKFIFPLRTYESFSLFTFYEVYLDNIVTKKQHNIFMERVLFVVKRLAFSVLMDHPVLL